MRLSSEITVAYFFFQVLLTSYIEGISADEGPEAKPKKDDLDGMDFLSEWSLWSRCSRSCGTGVQFRGRRCNRDRSPCLRYPRQHRTCNNQLCPVNSPDFRDVQCSKENDRGVMMKGKKAKWKSIQRGTTKCMLFCHPIGQRLSFYFGRAVDGTKCIDKPYSVCVAGKCTSVGCDRVIGSQKVFDRCKVCGGNGSTCEPYSGMIDREPTAKEKKEGYLKLFVIPEGATTILISEVSQNYLAVKRASGAFVFGGDKKMSDPGTYRVNTTDFQYSKLPSENFEAVMIMGPTKEEFHVMVILTNNDNPKADYEYWLPKYRPTTPPKPVFKAHTPSTSTKRRVTSKGTRRKTIFDDSNFLKGHKTELFFTSSERPYPHTQPMTTVGDLAESSPSTLEQRISTEYPTTTSSTHSSQPMTTAGDLGESSPSTPEQRISTEYPTTTSSTHSSQPMTTAGDLGESSPSTLEQRISTEYPTTTSSTHSSQPMTTAGDLGESSPSTPEQRISTEYPVTTASTYSSHPMTTAADLGDSSPSTPEQHISTEYSTRTVSTPSSQPMTTADDVFESSPSTPEQQYVSTEYSPTSTTSGVAVVLNGHHQSTVSRTSTSPSGQLITTKLSDRTTTTEHPVTTQHDGTTTTTKRPTTKTTKVESTEAQEHSVTPQQNKSTVIDPSTPSSTPSTDAPVTTKQPITTHLPISDNSSSMRFQPSSGTSSTIEHPNTSHMPTINTTMTQNGATTQPSQPVSEKDRITEGSYGTDGENETTIQPTVNEFKPNTSELNRNNTSMKNVHVTSTDEPGNRTTKELGKTETPSAQSNSTIQPTLLESTTQYEINATKTERVTETVSSEYSNKTGNSTPGASVNSTKSSGEVEGQLSRVENRTVISNNKTKYSTAQPTATENQNATVQPTMTTKNKNATIHPTATQNQNVTVQPTATENQNTTVQPTTTENQNVAVQPTATENQNTTVQPTATENQNTTVQPTATENQNTTVQPTATENQNTTVQPTATENQNTTVQPTATENQNTTVQPTVTENQNVTLQPTATQNQNVTLQPTATENQNVTVQPTATENQNVTLQPTTTENQIATVQPTTTENQNTNVQPTATENQNLTLQPTATENQNVTLQPTATENQNIIVQPTSTENQNVTVQPTATENENVTVQPTSTENQNATVQPTATENQNVTLQPTATENQNVTVQPTATENQNVTVQPTATENENVTVQPTSTENQNVTVQPTATENQNVTVQPTATENQNVTVQPTATENENVTVQPTSTENQNLSVQPTSTENQNLSVQPTSTENQNVTVQPTSTENQNVTVQPTSTENQNVTVQPTTTENQNVTVQPTATENQNVTVQPTVTENQNVTLQPTATENQNVTVQLTTTENQNATVQPTAMEFQNATAHPVTTAHVNTTLLTTTKSLNTTFDKVTSQNPTTYLNFTDHQSNRTMELDNATTRKSTTTTTEAITLPDITTTKRPTPTLEQTADKQFIDFGNYSSTEQPTTKERLSTEQDIVKHNGTVLPVTAGEANSTMSPRLEEKDKIENRTSYYMPWTQWTPCSRSCGLGFKVRAKLCKQNNESVCSKNETQIALCTIRQCEKLVPTWSPWRPWTECSSRCGIGLRVRVRSCRNSKVMTLVRTSCPGPRYQVGICRSFANCSPRVDPSATFSSFVKSTMETPSMSSCQGKSCQAHSFTTSASPKASLSYTRTEATSSVSSQGVFLIDTLETKTVSKMVLPVIAKMSSSMSSLTMGGFSSKRRKDDEVVTPVMDSSTSVEAFTRMTPSASMPPSSAPTTSTATSQSSSASASAPPSPSSTALLQPSPSSSSSTSSSSLLLPSPSSSSQSIPPPLKSSSSSTTTTSSIMLQPVLCASCANAASKSSSGHPLPTRMASLEPSLSATVVQTPKLSTSSPSMVDIAKTSSLQKPSTSRSVGGGFDASTMSEVHTSDVASIEPSRTSVVPKQESSTRVVQGICSRCRTSRKKQKLFCTGDYAIHVQVKNDSLTSNNKTMYHLLVHDIYKSNLPLAKDLFIRVTGIQCPCPRLETGRKYLIIGRARRTKKGFSKVLINRRSFVEEWSERVDSEAQVLRNRCLALGFNVSTSYLKTVDLKSPNNLENNSSVADRPSVIPTTGKPTTTWSSTITNKYSDCPPCVLSANSSIGALYCTSEYAIRARVTKYRKATNRTMFYAHLITTYKTTNELPVEVLIRVPGEICPCPRLMPGVEYLMIGKTKNTLTGKSRLTLTVENFYAEWRDELEKEIDTTKTRCGLPSTAPDQSTATLVPTVNAARPNIPQNNTSCSSCDQSTILDNQQKRFCKNENVFHGRVAKSSSTVNNRTLYYISVITSFKTDFEMPDKIFARLSDNSCQCARLTVGKEYLIMGHVKMNRRGKARVVLTKKSFIQDWNPGIIEKIDQLKAKCELPVVNNGSGPSTEPSGTPQEITTTPKKAVEATTATEVTRKGTCPPCRASANIHDFCSNDYVFRGRVLKGYRTSANRTVYHVSVTASYRSLVNLTSVVLVRIPGVSCPCPQLQVGVEYVIMGWVRVKRKSVSRMTLLPKNFVQKWDEGFEEELSSIRSSCKKSVVDGPLVQSVAVEKAKASSTASVMPKPSITGITTSTIRTTTQAPSSSTASLHLTNTKEKRCAPCQTSKKRNRLYCTSDYVLTVEIEKKEHNPVTHTTKFYAAVQYTFKNRDPLQLMIVLWVLNNYCNCPDLQLNHTYVIMVNSDFGVNGVERLVMSERSFVKEWTKGLHRRISKLKNTCYTDHKRRY